MSNLVWHLIKQVCDVSEQKGQYFDGSVQGEWLADDFLGQLENDCLLFTGLWQEVVNYDNELPVSVHDSWRIHEGFLHVFIQNWKIVGVKLLYDIEVLL
jgi:hypothetical protein